MKNSSLPAYKLFLSTPSARRATEQARKFIQQTFISIHALREEGDHIPAAGRHPGENFYPRPPRGGRRLDTPLRFGQSFISIHALREEGDNSHVLSPFLIILFLSTPSARRATFFQIFNFIIKAFLSTPSARRATVHLVFRVQAADISIHALREEGDLETMAFHSSGRISIHALREEGDSCTWSFASRQQIFLSTPSARRATHDRFRLWSA